MLRFVSERRAWVIAALVALALVAGLWVWGVARATSRASTLIGDRLGVDADIEEARLGYGALRLSDVELRGRHGGLVARVDEVEARLSFFAAFFKGAGAVEHVEAHGIDVIVDLGAEGFPDSLDEMVRRVAGDRRDASASAGRSSSGGGRTYEVSDLDVRVSDREGALVSIRNIGVRKEGNELQSSAEQMLLGDRDADHALVGPSKLALRRDAGAWRLSLLEIASGRVRALRNGNEQARPLATRLRDAVRKSQAGTEGRALDDPDASDEPPNESAASARLFARLTEDAAVSVSGVEIESRTSADGPVERIRNFELDVHGGDNGWYRVEVAGETSNKGTLSVDLSLQPSEARAEGSVAARRISLALVAPFVPELPLYETELSTASARLELAVRSPERVSIEGRFEVRELALSSERIAAEPVRNINVDLRGKGAWLPDERRLEIDGAQIRMNDARVLVEGELERTSEHYRVDLTAKLPPTDCNEVVGAIPKDVLGSLSRFEWSGNWSALSRLSLDSRDLEATELSIRVRNLCEFVRTPRWVEVERFQQPFRHRAIEPDETVFEMVTGPGTDNWVAFTDVSPFVVPAIISHEDGGFYDHAGFAPWAIRDALVRNLEEGRYVVGASTISMQLAKNLYLQREKTIARKVQEVILTWWLENALTKDEILELYLNVIEYGPGVYGLRHAASHYFGRSPSELSPAESAFLACMLPSPKRYHVSYERGALTRSMKSRSQRLLEHMAKRERIGSEALAYGLAELEDFRFHLQGDTPPAPRALPPLGAPEAPEPATLDPFEALFVAP